MQYALLIYQGTTPLPTDPDAWATLSEEEQRAVYRDYGSLNQAPGVTPGLPLGLPQDATTVRVEGGETVTSPGTYLSEGVGGYLVLEADDLGAAVELASRIPAARHGGAVEVRPVATYW
ncbi:MAG TPA: YciI family protein [Acidimicrobiales bacterium]|nr:YciI family protein [Acidimicrobiales bacterium]